MTLSTSAKRVQEALLRLGIDAAVQELADSTRTAQDAANALGVTVGQIVKSLVFIIENEPLLIETSGKNRVDLKKVEIRLGTPVRQATAEEVRDLTGYAVGGVPPIGHSRPIKTLVDEDLMQYEIIYAAAGTPFAVFRTTPQDLLRMTNGQVSNVRQ